MTHNRIRLNTFDNRGFDRGASRFKELIWMVTKSFLFRFHFPIPSTIRVFILRLFGARVGQGVVIRSGVNITFPWRLKVGDYCWIGEDVTMLSLAMIEIGDHCCISQRAFLCTGSHDFRSESFDLICHPIEVQSHSWVAANAFLPPGSIVLEGTMVKAGQTFRG